MLNRTRQNPTIDMYVYNFKKGEQGLKVKKLWKQDKDQRNKLKMKLKVY